MLATSDIVTLRHFTEQDFDAFKAYRNDPQVAEFQTWDHMSDAEIRDFLKHMTSGPDLFRPGKWTQIALADPHTNHLLGDMGLHLTDDGIEVELGITLARDHHRKGIATQAMRCAIALAFAQTYASHILAGADKQNTASLRLIEKLGFEWDRTEAPVGAPEGTPETDEIYLLQRNDVPLA
jgi:RimJ/RimL family protein N-acetyltransferase